MISLLKKIREQEDQSSEIELAEIFQSMTPGEFMIEN
jgi:hypothetical protein